MGGAGGVGRAGRAGGWGQMPLLLPGIPDQCSGLSRPPTRRFDQIHWQIPSPLIPSLHIGPLRQSFDEMKPKVIWRTSHPECANKGGGKYSFCLYHFRVRNCLLMGSETEYNTLGGEITPTVRIFTLQWLSN